MAFELFPYFKGRRLVEAQEGRSEKACGQLLAVAVGKGKREEAEGSFGRKSEGKGRGV